MEAINNHAGITGVNRHVLSKWDGFSGYSGDNFLSIPVGRVERVPDVIQCAISRHKDTKLKRYGSATLMVMSSAFLLPYLAWNITLLSNLSSHLNGQFWLETDAQLRIMPDNDLDHYFLIIYSYQMSCSFKVKCNESYTLFTAKKMPGIKF